MSAAVELLDRVRERLAYPTRWTKGASALDQSGAVVHPKSPDAKCWCLNGAITKEESDFGVGTIVVAALHRASGERGHGNLVNFNDTYRTTHADILSLIDRARELVLAGAEEARAGGA